MQVDEDDIATLAESGAAVAHCPRSNLRLHCGVAPVAELLAAGVTVGLGTDSLGSNDSLDMFAEMRAAVDGEQGARSPDRGPAHGDPGRGPRPGLGRSGGEPGGGKAGGRYRRAARRRRPYGRSGRGRRPRPTCR